MRLFIAAGVLAFALPGLALAQDKPTPTTKPIRGGNGGSIKNRDFRGGGPDGAGAAVRGNNSQPTDKSAGQPPAAGSKQ